MSGLRLGAGHGADTRPGRPYRCHRPLEGERVGAHLGEADVDTTLDRLADHIEKYLDCDRLLALAREPKLKMR